MKVLVADNREIVRLGLKIIVSEIWLGSQVSEATDLGEAIGYIAKDNYDLLLVNTAIDGKDELPDLIRLLLIETKVVLLSDELLNDNEEFYRLIGSRVDRLVLKDTTIEELRNLLISVF